MALAETAPVALTGAPVALFLAGVEMPMSKTTVKKAAKKTEVTGSTSTGGNPVQVWQEFTPGPSGGTLEAEGHWRVGQAISPPTVRQGALYAALAYVRRPGWLGVADAGSGFQGVIFVENNELTLDPNSGSVDWKLSTSFSGVIQDPS